MCMEFEIQFAVSTTLCSNCKHITVLYFPLDTLSWKQNTNPQKVFVWCFPVEEIKKITPSVCLPQPSFADVISKIFKIVIQIPSSSNH